MFYESWNPTDVFLRGIPSLEVKSFLEPLYLSVRCWKLYLINYKWKQWNAFLIARTLQSCKSRDHTLPGPSAPLSPGADSAWHSFPTPPCSALSPSLRCACAGEVGGHGGGEGRSARGPVGVGGRRVALLPPQRADGALRAPREGVAVWIPAPSLSVSCPARRRPPCCT